jgi:phage portal protein, SPP1 gp6-like|nr:MAG TPA: portal protein [Caudoviricetes sp.]
MEKKNLSAFRDYIKSKYRFAQMYANQLSKFGENNFRKKVFSIKSNLGNNDFQDEQLYIPINIARAVTRTFTNYVIGKGFSVDFGDDELNKVFVDIADNLKLQTLLNEAIDNQSCIGYSIIRVRSKDNTARVEIIPVANYLANMEGLTI